MKKLFRHHNLLWVLLILLALPAMLALSMILLGKNTLPQRLGCCYKLNGMTEASSSRPPFDLAHIRSRDIQKYLENRIATILPLRSFFIRINNQIYYSTFKKSFSENNQLIVGKSNQLFEKRYIDAYCSKEALNLKKLTSWANKLQELNRYFKKQGKTFIYITTPSKAEYVPDAIPTRFHCMDKGISPQVYAMEKLLKERKIPYINGSELMQTTRDKLHISLFPRGGIHWNELGATLGANAILNAINQISPKKVPILDFNYKVTQKPYGTDRDLMNLLNIMRPDDKYDVTQIDFKKPSKLLQPVKIALIGGSFVEQLVGIFTINKSFSTINYYRYFNEFEAIHDINKNKFTKRKVNPDSAAALTSILHADIVVLEENALFRESPHGALFYEVMQKFAL